MLLPALTWNCFREKEQTLRVRFVTKLNPFSECGSGIFVTKLLILFLLIFHPVWHKKAKIVCEDCAKGTRRL